MNKKITKTKQLTFETDLSADEFCKKEFGLTLEVAFKFEKIFYNYNIRKYYVELSQGK